MSAAQIEERAARWLLQQEEPDWSDVRQAELDAWLEESIAHKVAFYRLEHGWAKVGRLAALKSTTTATRRTRVTARRGGPTAIAACLVGVLSLGAILAANIPVVGRASYETAVGGRESVPLADGTKLEMSTDTRLHTAVSANHREVWLDRGEAYFEVAHDPAHPFVVYAGDRKVTVLGTKFSVRRDADRVRVAVVEGRVRVDRIRPAGLSRPELVTRGDIVVAQGPSTLVSAPSPERVAGVLSWRSGMLTFDQVTLAEAAAEFNRFNRTRLVLGDKVTAQTRIGGTFKAEDVEAFASLLQSAYGLKVRRHDGEVEISS